MFATEAALGERVVRWLELGGVDVYQEVEIYGLSGRADIIGVDGPHVIVIELKLSLTLDLLEQASRWRPFAHDVWIAVPGARGHHDRRFAKTLAELLGIGLLEVWPDPEYSPGIDGVYAVVQPRFNRRAASKQLRAGCRPQHKTFARAGAARGGQFTPFKGTCEAVLAYVRTHNGCSIKELVEQVPTHYGSKATARARMAWLIARDAVPGVGIVDGKLFATSSRAASGPGARLRSG